MTLNLGEMRDLAADLRSGQVRELRIELNTWCTNTSNKKVMQELQVAYGNKIGNVNFNFGASLVWKNRVPFTIPGRGTVNCLMIYIKDQQQTCEGLLEMEEFKLDKHMLKIRGPIADLEVAPPQPDPFVVAVTNAYLGALDFYLQELRKYVEFEEEDLTFSKTGDGGFSIVCRRVKFLLPQTISSSRNDLLATKAKVSHTGYTGVDLVKVCSFELPIF